VCGVFVAVEQVVVDVFGDACVVWAVWIVIVLDVVEVLVKWYMACVWLCQHASLSAVETFGSLDVFHGLWGMGLSCWFIYSA